jgi:signal transduction histidine kinase
MSTPLERGNFIVRPAEHGPGGSGYRKDAEKERINPMQEIQHRKTDQPMPDNVNHVDVDSTSSQPLKQLAASFGELESVMAVVLAGSRSANSSDAQSDFDLYVYTSAEIPIEFRRALFGPRAEIDNRFWEPGDESLDNTGRRIDVMYRSPLWIEEQLDRVLVRHQASIGYTTCFWFNVLHSEPFFDRAEWFHRLKHRANIGYPDELRHAIVARNWPILRRNQSSYRHQVELALQRDDAVSVHHRITALLASFFDICFALERSPHPGEKRLLKHLPPKWAQRVRVVLQAQGEDLLTTIDQLLDPLDARLRQEKLITD